MSYGLKSCQQPRFSRRDALVLALMASVALVLRWWRLDLMPFRYDAAEALARTREALAMGHPPWTGIVNSLGFRNPPGLEWIIFPAVMLSPDPRVAAAWIGLLIVSGIMPAWRIGYLLGGRPAAWFLALLYAFLPQTIFASRDVWAQHLLIPLGAWGLMFALRAVLHVHDFGPADASSSDAPDAASATVPRSATATSLSASVLCAAVATTVHMASILWFLGLLGYGFFAVGRRRHAPRWRPVLALAGIGALLLVALLPSLFDWYQTRRFPPREKPPHVSKFEMLAPPPKPIPGRLQEAYSGLFDPLSTTQVLGGIEQHLPPAPLVIVNSVDLLLLAFALGGLARLLLLAAPRARPAPADPSALRFARLLLTWLLLPPVFVAVFMRYPNATYLYFSMTGLLACVLVGWQGLLEFLFRLRPPRAAHLPRPAAAPAIDRLFVRAMVVPIMCVCLIYGGFYVMAMDTVARVRTVNGPYYSPLREQLGLVREFDKAGIGRDHLVHLGGAWFQRSYDYLLDEVLRVPPRPAAVVMEDTLLRRSQPERLEFVRRSLDREWATIRWRVFPSLAEAQNFADMFYRIPARFPTSGQ
jgi:hypothetical protein